MRDKIAARAAAGHEARDLLADRFSRALELVEQGIGRRVRLHGRAQGLLDDLHVRARVEGLGLHPLQKGFQPVQRGGIEIAVAERALGIVGYGAVVAAAVKAADVDGRPGGKVVELVKLIHPP